MFGIYCESVLLLGVKDITLGSFLLDKIVLALRQFIHIYDTAIFGSISRIIEVLLTEHLHK